MLTPAGCASLTYAGLIAPRFVVQVPLCGAGVASAGKMAGGIGCAASLPQTGGTNWRCKAWMIGCR